MSLLLEQNMHSSHCSTAQSSQIIVDELSDQIIADENVILIAVANLKLFHHLRTTVLAQYCSYM